TTALWSYTGSLNTARFGAMATLLNSGEVLVAAGGVNAPSSSAELYDPTTSLWSYTGSMNTAREDAAAILLPNGEVLVASGGGQRRCRFVQRGVVQRQHDL